MDEMVRLLWGPPARPTRGPKPALSLERIARAGVEIADAEGLGAVTMQRVAEQLGKTKMSLYRYVPGKAELVALMVESAIGEVTEAREGGWRERLDAWSHGLSVWFHEHPWLLDATLGARVMGPKELAWLEEALVALEGTGLTGAERMDAVVLLTGHVRGIAAQARATGPGERTEEQLTLALGEVMREHGERFPALGETLASVDATGGRDQALDFGLERILDGLETLIARRG